MRQGNDPHLPHGVPVRLDADSVEAVARAVARLLAEQRAEPPVAGGLVDAAAVARALGVSRATVYAHGADLGARRLGNRGRLRFDLAQALAAWSARPADVPAPESPRARPRARGTRPSRGLLPINGRPA